MLNMIILVIESSKNYLINKLTSIIGHSQKKNQRRRKYILLYIYIYYLYFRGDNRYFLEKDDIFV